MFDKGKRNQLIREVCTLYNANCPRLVIICSSSSSSNSGVDSYCIYIYG